LEWGKDREVLPITTGEAAMLSRYPTLWTRRDRKAQTVIQKSEFPEVAI